MSFLCIAPLCFPENCCNCNCAISEADTLKYAKRYAYLRQRPIDTVEMQRGGVFAGQVPENIVLNEHDLDAEIDKKFSLLWEKG